MADDSTPVTLAWAVRHEASWRMTSDLPFRCAVRERCRGTPVDAVELRRLCDAAAGG